MKNTDIRDLNLDQLGKVSGGNEVDTQNDSYKLHKLGLLDEYYGSFDLTFSWASCTAKIEEAWAKIGITCVTDFICANQYYYEGKKITRKEAVEIAENTMIKGPKIGFPVY